MSDKGGEKFAYGRNRYDKQLSWGIDSAQLQFQLNSFAERIDNYFQLKKLKNDECYANRKKKCNYRSIVLHNID